MSETARHDADPSGCVIVTGGSRGLGLALVRRLLDRGLPVATFARKRTAEIDELEGAGARLMFTELDALDDQAITEFVKQAE